MPQIEQKASLRNIADGLIGLAASRSGSALGVVVSAIWSLPAPAPWVEAAKVGGIVAIGAVYLSFKAYLDKGLATKPGYDPATGKMDTEGVK